VFSPFPCPRLPPRRVMTRLDDDTATTRSETCQNTSRRRHGHDEVQDVSRHVSNTPGMRLQGPNDETGFRRLCPWYVFFFSCLLSSPKLETRVSSCFFIFFFLLYHHETRRRRVSCIFFQVLPQGLETRVSSPFFLIFFITTDKNFYR